MKLASGQDNAPSDQGRASTLRLFPFERTRIKFKYPNFAKVYL